MPQGVSGALPCTSSAPAPFAAVPVPWTFNEHTGTLFNHLQASPGDVLRVIPWPLRYRRSLRDSVGIVLARGVIGCGCDVREG